MGLRKFRSDIVQPACPNGAVECMTKWMGGPSLATVQNCPCDGALEAVRRTVHVQGEPDTWFSVPAACSYKGRTYRGFLSYGDEGPTFTPYTKQNWEA